MTVFIDKDPQLRIVTLLVRAEGPDMIGDMFIDIRPGDSAFDRTYEEWMQSNEESIEVR